jgi:hypothetical protein
MLAQAKGGGQGVDTHTSFGEGRRRARVNRFQHFCRCRVRAPGVEGRLRRIFQAELNDLGYAWSTQLHLPEVCPNSRIRFGISICCGEAWR